MSMDMFSDAEFEKSKNDLKARLQAKRAAKAAPPPSPFGEEQESFDFKPTPAPATKVSKKKPLKKASSMRRQVESIEDIDFEVPPQRIKKAPAKIKYVNKRPAKKAKKLSGFKIAWIFMLALLLRLIFVERGVIDYFNQQTEIASRQTEIARLEAEKANLEKTIVKIKRDKRFQKGLLRDHLGVISSDEYLILFAKEMDDPSK